MALTDKLTAIADAIRDKTKTTETLTLDQMPEMISSITGGGNTEEYVNFYDYDGSLLHQYPLSVFQNMSTLPLPPKDRDGCICKGWNYDLDSIKSMNCHVNVSAIYNQKDEETETHTPGEPSYVDGTKLYLHVVSAMNITLYFRQTVANGVTVNWGDGESSQSGSNTGSTNLNLTHAYEPGDYIVTFTLAENCILSLGAGSTSISVMGNCGSVSSTYVPRWGTLVKAEIDLRNTSLLTGTFRYCIGLTEVIIGNGRSMTIPSYVFDQCYALENIQLCDDITTIYEYAFRQCYRLRNIEIPTSVTSIGSYAFVDCRRLHDISIPGTVKTVSSYAFQNCMALRKVQLGSGVETLGSCVFYACYHLESINLPNTLKTLNTQVFYQCYSLTSLIFPVNISAVPNGFCQNCYALKTVVLPEGLKTIGGSAFANCYGLKFIGIPASVTTISDAAFSSCYNLHNAVIGVGTTSIGAKAFSDAYGLEYIILPPSVTTLGIRTFDNSRSLKNVVVPSKLMAVTGGIVGCESPSQVMADYYSALLEACSEIREGAFESNRAFETAEVPDAVTSLGVSAFRYNYALRKAIFPVGLLSIGNYAFQYDYQLESPGLPVTLTSIGSNAFEQCQSNECITIPGSVRTIDSTCFASNYGLKKVEVKANSMTVNGSAFSSCYSLKELDIAAGVTTITFGGSAFNCTGMEEVTGLPHTTKITGTSLYCNCYGLETADLTPAVFDSTSVGNSMFQNCYALGKVQLPDSLLAVGSSMFQYCYALKEISISENVSMLYSNAFYECRNLETVEFLGHLVDTIQSNAFYYCLGLKSIRIPYSVTTMQQCFNNCMALHDVYMYPLTAPTGVTSIGGFAEGYVIHVPKGYLSGYETQWTSHAGHFEEFEFMIADKPQINKMVGLSAASLKIKNAFIHTAFDEDQTFTITYDYTGNNLVAISNLSFDYENSVVSFDFERAEEVDYDIREMISFHISVDGTDISCDFSVQLRYVDRDLLAEYEVTCPAGYAFVLGEDGYYASSNTGIHNTYSLAKVTFVTNTGKLYVDCIGQGETNFDFGIVSNLDCTLSSNNNVDSGTTVKKSFYGLGTYNQTLEYDVEDGEEHFIYIKYRKDASQNTGTDNLKFRIRFEEE